MPAFSLQPIVENAIKHGTSQLLGIGRIRISARVEDEMVLLSVEDNAGLYIEPSGGDGLGMHLVRRRIATLCGASFGLEVRCERELFTRVTLKLPLTTSNVPTAMEVYPA
jgi:two-component system LytT family sensor kinase